MTFILVARSDSSSFRTPPVMVLSRSGWSCLVQACWILG